MPLAPKGLNKSNIGGNAGPNFLLLIWGTRYTELFMPNMIHAQYLLAIFPILHLDRTSALTRAQYTCRQLAVVIQICVDCTAINNQVNNIPSLPSGPCIQWGGGGGGGGGGGYNCTRLHPPGYGPELSQIIQTQVRVSNGMEWRLGLSYVIICNIA